MPRRNATALFGSKCDEPPALGTSAQDPGFVPLEQVIAYNLNLLFHKAHASSAILSASPALPKMTVGARHPGRTRCRLTPGSIIAMVTNELTAESLPCREAPGKQRNA